MGFGASIISLFMSAVLFVGTFFGISPEVVIPEVKLDKITSEETVSVGNFDFYCDADGFSVAFDGVTMFENAETRYVIDDISYSSLQYEDYKMSVKDVSDERGNGKKITVTLTGDGLDTLVQYFIFYIDTDYFLVNAVIESAKGVIETNYIAPVVVTDGKIQNGEPKWTNFLEVPFSNDNWAEFETTSVVKSGMSHEVGAFFTPDDRDGFIIGSVTHNTWKSAVSYESNGRGIEELYAFSGVTSDETADQTLHGKVSGYSVTSAIFFFGFYDNWKIGMNEFADVNVTYSSKRESVIDTNPIGWNSWGAVQSNLDYSVAIETSDYIKENFQDVWAEDSDVIYVNLDSYWDNLSSEELKNFVAHCKENGQTAGVYFAPFVTWFSESELDDYYVEGTDYTFYDIVLRKNDGEIYSSIDGCFPLDVTHPATKTYYKTKLKELMSYGFKYIKLDFLTHGALEGDFYNEEIKTGIQAYNYAMKEVCKTIGSKVFINMAISPIFPYCYANGRRLCCDTYSKIDETEYMMNSLTYGFWQSRLYDYIDPDHIVLWGREGNTNYREAKSRLLSGIVTGGSFLTGDNFISPAGDSSLAAERYSEMLTNEKLLGILKTGKTFEALIDNNSPKTSDVFTYESEKGTFVAVFNYSKFLLSFNIVDVPEGLIAVDILSGKVRTYKEDKLVVVLPPSDCAIYELITEEEYALTLYEETTVTEEVSTPE